MTLPELKTLLLTVDSHVSHYKGGRQGNYTVWAEHDPDDLTGDGDVEERVWNVQIDRFTKLESDPVVDAITELLDDNDIGYEIIGPVFEQDTGYIHHIWDCSIG